MNDYNTIALLPIKAHSARVPGKNFRSFAGRPLFAWILETLLEIDEIELVVINTDARSILESHGLGDSDRVLIRDREQRLCGDFVSMNHVIANDVQEVRAQTYLMTHTTNPLLKARTILKALQFYEQQRKLGLADSLFTANRFQSRFYRSDGSAINHDPQNLLRTQDLEPWFEENSNLYIFSAESFKLTNARIGGRPILFETPRCESLDIDDQDGWDLAEAVARPYLDKIRNAHPPGTC